MIEIALIVGMIVGACLVVLSPKKGGRHARGSRMTPDDRSRQVIKESIQIATDTKRRATAESRLKVAEDALNGLLMETAEDRRSRQAIKSLRDDLSSRFLPSSKMRSRKN